MVPGRRITIINNCVSLRLEVDKNCDLSNCDFHCKHPLFLKTLVPVVFDSLRIFWRIKFYRGGTLALSQGRRGAGTAGVTIFNSSADYNRDSSKIDRRAMEWVAKSGEGGERG